MGILMSRGFKICMVEGGRKSLGSSYCRPKLTLVSRFFSTKLRCQDSKTLSYILPSRSDIEARWVQRCWAYFDPISEQLDENWRCAIKFWNHLFFVTRPIWSHFDPLQFGKVGPVTQTHILNPECIMIPRVLSPNSFPVEKFWLWRVSP